MMHALIFKLDKKKSLCLISDDLPMEQIYICCQLDMYWLDDKKRLIIGQDDAGGFLEQLERTLSLALQQQLKLDPSIQKSLGYYWNEIFADRRSFVDLVYRYTSNGKHTSWIGKQYLLSNTYDEVDPTVSTWIYNNAYGDIILEVTPMFVWAGDEITTQEELDRYFAFLKDYKPILQQIIPQAIAQEWLEQAQKWYKVFYDNEQKDCGR